MRVVIQRVKKASVHISGEKYSKIKGGLLVLLGIENADNQGDVDWLVSKIVQMRIFSDAEDKMNLSLQNCGGELLIISQFTLHASTKKGNRPSFIEAARPEKAIPLYEYFVAKCKESVSTKSGVFGADMQVKLVNDGPVTIFMDSKNKG
ncbi:MAG: hypothetical protein RLZZ337_1603 [Bacteroidota bacterium]|jgi:D-tyrosyl-tRNA(Tyr) deacylase